MIPAPKGYSLVIPSTARNPKIPHCVRDDSVVGVGMTVNAANGGGSVARGLNPQGLDKI